MWAKRVTWRCPKPSEAPVDWLGRTIQEQARDEEAAYWRQRDVQMQEWLDRYLAEQYGIGL